MSSGRTGTRVRGLSDAARMAATIAAVEAIVGASAIPLRPYGDSACGSSRIFASTGGMSRIVGIR